MLRIGHGLSRFPQRFSAVFIRVVGLLVSALLAQSFLWSPANPLALKIAVAGVAVLAAARPDVALLVLAAVVPFGRVISTLLSPGAPVDITEALALAYLAGWAFSRLRRRVDDGPASSGLLLGYGLAAVVAASLLVDVGILRYWKDYWQPFLGQLLAYLGRDFLNIGVETRPWASGLGGLLSATAAARFLEGLGLMRAAQTLSARNPAFGRQLLWTLAIAAMGTAILSVESAVQLSVAEGRDLVSVFQTSRITAHVAKINSAASHFVLFILVLIGLGVRSAQSRSCTAWILALRATGLAAGVGLLLMALWLTGTRTAMVAGGIVAVGASAYAAMRSRLGDVTRRSAIGVVAAAVIVCALLGYGFYLRSAAVEASGTRGSLPVRLLMWHAALKTVAARPVFGVGVGQFPYQVSAFDPDAALSADFDLIRFNAHNQFLEVTAELGVIGGLLFVGMFAAILWRAWRAFRASHDPVLGGAIAGLVAFLITCLAGQPLLYNVVAFPFWLVLGVSLAAGDAVQGSRPTERTAASRRRWSRVTAAFLMVLALSIPARVWQGMDSVNFALAKYGFSAWHQPGYGRPYRLVRDAGAFFTYPQARSLTLPIRRDVEAGRNRLEVEVSLDGRRERTLTLVDDEWQTVELTFPPDATRRFRRIDLAVRAPAGVAAQVRVAAAEISKDQSVEQGRSR